MKKESRDILRLNNLIFKNITIFLLLVIIGIYLDKYFNLNYVFTFAGIFIIISIVVINVILRKKKSK